MGDQSTIKCKSLDLICELEFKTKVGLFHISQTIFSVSHCKFEKGLLLWSIPFSYRKN